MLKNEKRTVTKKPFVITGKYSNDVHGNNVYDETHAMGVFLQSEIDYITKLGNPQIITFDFAFEGKNYLKLEIPLIPFVYGFNDEKLLQKMVEQGDPELVRDIYRQIQLNDNDKKEAKEFTKSQANDIVNYMRHELAGAWIEAYKNDNTALQNHIASLYIMKDVDLTPEKYSTKNRIPSKCFTQYKTGSKTYTLCLQPKEVPEDYKGKDMFSGDDKAYIDYKESILPKQLEALKNYEEANQFDSPNF